ncbi:unnamed protein product, partial [Sphenostylis stenocarpa]
MVNRAIRVRHLVQTTRPHKSPVLIRNYELNLEEGKTWILLVYGASNLSGSNTTLLQKRLFTSVKMGLLRRLKRRHRYRGHR